MIARAAHSVNAGLSLSSPDVGTIEGVDLAATVERIVGWGGDAKLYLHFLGRGIDAGALTSAGARALGVVAGWRSGVVDLRDEALAHVAQLSEEVATAALGLAAGQREAFVAQQASDPFAWPTSDSLVARIGGFSGFGGVWVTPPTLARFVSSNVVEITCGAERWAAHVDVFGVRVTRADGATSATTFAADARALVSENSYLVDIARGAA
jgi:hypothetical protein